MPSRRSIALAIVSLLALAAPAHSQQPSPAGVVESPRQVTGDANPLRVYDIPALAIDPRDANTIVMAVGDARNGGCGLRVSRDGGLSWATMAPEFSPDGTLYVAMPSSSPENDPFNGPIDLLVARSNDLGATHDTVTVAKSESVTLNPADYGGRGTAQEGNSWHKFPGLRVDPTNPERVFAGWRWYVWGKNMQALPGDVPFRPYFAASEDGGKTWGTPVDMLAVSKGDQAYGGSAPMQVVAQDGTIYGVSKELLKSAAPGETNPNPMVLLFKSTDHRRSWTTSTVRPGGPNLQASPEIAIDPSNGNLYVVYGVGPAHTSADKPPPGPQKVPGASGTGTCTPRLRPMAVSPGRPTCG